MISQIGVEETQVWKRHGPLERKTTPRWWELGLFYKTRILKNTLEQELFHGLFEQLTWKKNEHNETNEKEFDRN